MVKLLHVLPPVIDAIIIDSSVVLEDSSNVMITLPELSTASAG